MVRPRTGPHRTPHRSQVSQSGDTLTTRYVYDGEDIILQTQSDGTTTTVTPYVHGPGIDEPLAMIKDSGQPFYYHADGLDSIVAITDASGNIVQRYSYEAFGQLTAHYQDFDNFYTYTGREYDKETGLYYYRARYYDAMEGRFISKDPIGFAGGDVNLYNYVGGNPINYVDPLGYARYFVSYDFTTFSLLFPPVGGTFVSGTVVSTERNNDGTYDGIKFSGRFSGASLGVSPYTKTYNNEEYFNDDSECPNPYNVEGESWYLAGSGALGRLGVSGGAYRFGNMLGEKETPSSAHGFDLSVDFMTGKIRTVGGIIKFNDSVFPESR